MRPSGAPCPLIVIGVVNDGGASVCVGCIGVAMRHHIGGECDDDDSEAAASATRQQYGGTTVASAARESYILLFATQNTVSPLALQLGGQL